MRLKAWKGKLPTTTLTAQRTVLKMLSYHRWGSKAVFSVGLLGMVLGDTAIITT